MCAATSTVGVAITMRSLNLNADSYRILPSHFPPIALFENLLEPDELEAAYALEGLTNDRLRDQVGDISMVLPEDRVTGPGSTPIMAAFTHIGVESRFTKGYYGIYYAGLELSTALAESKFRRETFMRATDEPPQIMTMRCYQCRISGEVVDLRDIPEVHNPDSFAYAQGIAEKLREESSQGVLYRSVRQPGGECIAAFRPSLLEPPARQRGHYQFHWDGSSISAVLEVNAVL